MDPEKLNKSLPLVIDKGDFTSGATNRSSRILHFGLGVFSIIIIFLFQGCMTYDKDRTGPGSLLLEQNELENLFSVDVTYHIDLQCTSVAITCFSDGTQELTT